MVFLCRKHFHAENKLIFLIQNLTKIPSLKETDFHWTPCKKAIPTSLRKTASLLVSVLEKIWKYKNHLPTVLVESRVLSAKAEKDKKLVYLDIFQTLLVMICDYDLSSIIKAEKPDYHFCWHSRKKDIPSNPETGLWKYDFCIHFTNAKKSFKLTSICKINKSKALPICALLF